MRSCNQIHHLLISSRHDWKEKMAWLGKPRGVHFLPELVDCGTSHGFLDAIKEGDGARIIRQYKYFMLYCKAD